MVTRLSSILCKTAFLAALCLTAACATMEDTYNEMMGEESSATASSKVGVKSPAAAPVQDVNAQEIINAEKSAEKPVELGSISDNRTASANAPVAPSAPAEQPKMEAATAAAPAPAPTSAAPAAPAPVASNSSALLVIRFNQPRVYYDDALSQSVGVAEKAKTGVEYEVLSTIPDLTSLPVEQQTKLSARAKDNLRNVVLKMQQQGVSPERIRIAEQTLKIRSQEIRIFVK